jgi:KUP system potassium uptake protein
LGLGVVGASLFYGDALITPAISVLSAVEGLEIAQPELAEAVLPIGVVVLAVLFAAQRFGTHRVGGLFGPIMIVWFVCSPSSACPRLSAIPKFCWGCRPPMPRCSFSSIRSPHSSEWVRSCW